MSWLTFCASAAARQRRPLQPLVRSSVDSLRILVGAEAPPLHRFLASSSEDRLAASSPGKESSKRRWPCNATRLARSF